MKYVIILNMDASLEQKLLQGMQQLDPDSLTEIYNQYSSGIYAYSMRLLGDSDLAEECVSETFSRFLKAAYSGRGPQTHLRAYLYRIAQNWIMDYYRRKTTVPLDTIENVIPDEVSNIQDITEENIRQTRLRQALAQLVDSQRQVIILRFLEGWDNEEIAAAISRPISAIKAIQYRAIENLRKILVPQEADE